MDIANAFSDKLSQLMNTDQNYSGTACMPLEITCLTRSILSHDDLQDVFISADVVLVRLLIR